MPTNQGHPLDVMDAPEPRSARQTINDMLDAGLLDEVMDRVDTEAERLHHLLRADYLHHPPRSQPHRAQQTQ
jgi:hypothetical protein